MAEPKRIQVRDRFKAVLESIRAEDGYNYTPDLVTTKFIDFVKGPGKIRLLARTDSGGEIKNYSGVVDEIFYIAIDGYVENLSDANLAVERVIQDVRTALDNDDRSPDAGTLGALGVLVVMDEPPEIDHELALEGHNLFTQRFRCHIAGADFSGL